MLLLSVEDLNIASLIIGIVSSAIAIIEAIILVLIFFANKLNRRTFSVKFEAQPPAYIGNYPRPIVQALFHCTNKTKTDWTITKIELVTDNRTIPISEKDKTIEICIRAKSNRTFDSAFVVPSYFLNLPSEGTLKVYVGMKCLSYSVKLPQQTGNSVTTTPRK